MLNQPTLTNQPINLNPQIDGCQRDTRASLKELKRWNNLTNNIQIMVVFYYNPKNKINIIVFNDINKWLIKKSGGQETHFSFKNILK